MPILHTINQHQVALDFAYLNEGDAILFWQNGVILALAHSEFLNKLAIKNVSLYALENDLAARGLQHQVSPQVKMISLRELVDLTRDFFPQKCWP